MAVAEGKTIATVPAEPPANQFQRGTFVLPGIFQPSARPYEDAVSRLEDVALVGSGVSGDAGIVPVTRILWAQPSASWVDRLLLFAGKVTAQSALAQPRPFATSVLLTGRASEAIRNVASIREPTWEQPTLQRLFDLLVLPRDWDSNGSGPPSFSAVIEAFTFLTRVLSPGAAPPSAVPLSGGGVQLEWHRRGTDVEVTLGPVEDRGMYIEDASGPWEGSVDDPADVTEFARRLSEVAAVIDG